MESSSTLAIVWYLFLAVVFYLYVVLDGFDLGAGILTLFSRDEKFHSVAAGSILGVWHANQTWLIVFGGTLFGAFPLVYGVVLSALYIPVALMLFGLILRGVALEYYYQASKSRNKVAFLYGLGSLIASAAQGLGVGAWLSGIPVEAGRFSGGIFSWLTPLAILLGIGLPFFYTMLGATRLIPLCQGDIKTFCENSAQKATLASLGGAGLVVVWALAASPFWAGNWFVWPGALLTLLPLLLGAAALVILLLSLVKGRAGAPFGWSVLAVTLLFFGVAAGVYPVLAPPDITIFKAASPAPTQTFMLIGIGLFTPLIIVYTLYMYRVFGGRSAAGELDHP